MSSTAICSLWAWSAAGSCCTGGAPAKRLLEDRTGAAVDKRTSRILYNTHMVHLKFSSLCKSERPSMATGRRCEDSVSVTVMQFQFDVMEKEVVFLSK